MERTYLTLKQARTRRGLSLGGLALVTGIAKSTLSRLEAGDTAPLHATVCAIERGLELAPGTLRFGRSRSRAA